MARYVASIDQGTTSTRCILFDAASNAVASAQREHRQIFPRPGWVEHDPLEIWDRTQAVVKETLSAAAVRPGEVAAVGVTNQRETTVIWDSQAGRPLYNAIVWQDTRTKPTCEALEPVSRDRLGPGTLQQRVGLPLSTYF